MKDAGKIAFTPKGNYDNKINYEYLDVVQYAGNCYAAKKATVGNYPPTTDSCVDDNWVILLDGNTVISEIPVSTETTAGIVKAGEDIDVDENGEMSLKTDFTEQTELSELTGTENRKTSFGKIAKAIKDFINHIKTKATDKAEGHVKVTDSSAVTDSTGLALPATEKNATIKGTLAHQIQYMHNKLFPGRRLLSLHYNGTVTAGVLGSLEELHTAIQNGFENIFVGDYIDVTMSTSGLYAYGGYVTSGETTKTAITSPVVEMVRLLVADYNYFLHSGDTETAVNHLILVPECGFSTLACMNLSNVTTGGYAGSEMHTTVLPAYENSLKELFGKYMIPVRALLTNTVNADVASSCFTGWKGTSSNWALYSTYLCLMNSPMVTGCNTCQSSFYDTGNRKTQLALFRQRPDLQHTGYANDRSKRRTYWLSDVASGDFFAYVGGSGDVSCGYASYPFVVRPFLVIS